MLEHNAFADQLNIETPEQVDLRFPVAGLGSRFLALLLDSLLQGLFYLVLGIILYATSSSSTFERAMDHQSATGQKWLAALFILLNFLMVWGYFVLFEAYWNGQTPGKRIMNVRVLKDSGRSVTLFESMARNLLRVVDALPGMYLIGVIAMLCNRASQRLGDLVAGTIVVHERADEQPLLNHMSRTFTVPAHSESSAAMPQRWMPHAQAEWTANQTALPADAVARLKPADLHIVETFFSRALDLSVEKRAELAARVAARMCSTMNITPPESITPEQMLELLAYRMRSQTRS